MKLGTDTGYGLPQFGFPTDKVAFSSFFVVVESRLPLHWRHSSSTSLSTLCCMGIRARWSSELARMRRPCHWHSIIGSPRVTSPADRPIRSRTKCALPTNRTLVLATSTTHKSRTMIIIC
ncbi:hypothetical protein M758_3G008200 [Ceratodon purpureus]|nr:hypothetical protein M758_3G008200 [Ceratodon purpureus]